MFKSKGFTIAFVILSLMIIALSGFFIYLLTTPEAATNLEMKFISGTEPAGTEAPATTTAAPTTTTAAPTTTTVPESSTREPDTELRGLYDDQTHLYPVLGEDIPLKGKLTIIRSGDSGEGLVFHKLPRFDAADAQGNQTIYSGDFRIVAKVYVEDNGRPVLMYKTEDGFYVTGNTTYVTFTADSEPLIARDATKITSYGYEENGGAVVIVYSEDGNHLTFSILNYVDGNSSPALTNIVAEYDEYGTGHFEYQNSDGKRHEGTILFEDVSEAYISKRVIISLDSPIRMLAGEISEINVHN